MQTVPKPSPILSIRRPSIAEEERFADIVRGWMPTDRVPSGPITTIATDGAFRRGAGGGSFAWVAEDAAFGAGRALSRSSFHAELIAVDEALRAQPQFTRIRLLVDCRQALEAVAHVLARPPARRERTDAIERRLASIADAGAHREVALEWVRGHSGHPLNDAADRIAVLHRRSEAWGGRARRRRGALPIHRERGRCPLLVARTPRGAPQRPMSEMNRLSVATPAGVDGSPSSSSG